MKIFDKIRYILLIILILFLHIGTLLVSMDITTTQIISYILYFNGAINLITYIIYKIIKKEKIKIKDILIILLIVFAIISTIFAYDIKTALYGAYARYEGLFSLISYYSIFLLSTTIDNKYQRKLLNLMIFFGFFQIIIGTIQTLRIDNILGYDRSNNWSTNFYFASGTFSNPNFYSTYILMCTLYLLGNLFNENKLSKKILLCIITAIFTYGLIIGNTTSSILVFIFISIIKIILSINKKNLKKNICLFLIFIVVSFIALILTDKYKNNNLYLTMRNNFNSVINILKYGIKDSTGNHRIYVWKETLEEVPKNLYTGIGIDNFEYIKNGSPIRAVIEDELLFFDKAHNDYLQILITQGIFALITYLILVFKTIYTGIISNLRKENNGLFLAFLGYLLQMIIVFSYITVAPFYYMIMGFIISNNKSKVN